MKVDIKFVYMSCSKVISRGWSRSRIFAGMLFIFLTLYLFLSDTISLGEPHQPFNTTENALFGNGKTRLMKVYFDKAVVEPPGVILKTKGGIGNQLFQYACSYALARDKNWTLYTFVDTKSLLSNGDINARKFLPLQREFALDHFNIPLDNLIDSTSKIRGTTRIIYDDELLDGRMDLLRGGDDNTFLELYPESYCQSVEYWKPYRTEIEDMFWLNLDPKSESEIHRALLYQIKNSESVAVHVRRGDFTKIKGNEVPISYQRSAMKEMSNILKKRGKLPVFFVLSDDIQYARKALKDLRSEYDIIFVSDPRANMTSLQEFHLMIKCKNIILPNSTFSWWAAFLNKNKDKVVIASTLNPKIFEGRSEGERKFRLKLYGALYYPTEWIIMNPFENRSDSEK